MPLIGIARSGRHLEAQRPYKNGMAMLIECITIPFKSKHTTTLTSVRNKPQRSFRTLTHAHLRWQNTVFFSVLSVHLRPNSLSRIQVHEAAAMECHPNHPQWECHQGSLKQTQGQQSQPYWHYAGRRSHCDTHQWYRPRHHSNRRSRACHLPNHN